MLKCLFGMAKLSNKNNKNIVGMSCIHGKYRNIKASVEEKMEMWKEYDKKLLNEENECSGKLNVEKNEGPYKKMFVKAVVKALNFTRTGKAARPSDVTFQLLKMSKNNSTHKQVGRGSWQIASKK